MPRNRADQTRDDKRDQIIHAAGRLFATDGFDGTSVAAIAAEARITKNTVYWYFADKDAVLLAVLSRAFRAASRRWDGEPVDLAERLVEVVQAFAEVESLTTTLHARLSRSEALREWHERFHATGDAWLAQEIQGRLARRGSPPLEADAVATVVRVWSMAIEGMVTHALPPAERLAVCTLLVEQVDAQAARARRPEGSGSPAGRALAASAQRAAD